MISPKKDITGIILAGGKSSRMGSDKGFLVWKNKKLIHHVIHALEPLSKKIIIVSDHENYADLGYTCIEDKVKNAGPLSGIYTGLSASETELNWILSCDVPLVSTALLEKILLAKKPSDNAVICKSVGKLMPLVGLYEKNCAENCLNLLNKKEYRIRQLIADLTQVQILQLTGQLATQTMNINTPEDLKKIENDY